MKKIVKAIGISAMLITILASCATTKGADASGVQTEEQSVTKKEKKQKKAKKAKKGKFDQEAFNQAYASGDYATCISMIQEIKNEKNLIKNSLDADMLSYFNKEYLNSAKGFMETQGLMQQSAEDTSAGKQFAAAIAGENSVKYTGNVYERILAYSMRAVNAIELGDFSNAKGVMDNYTGDYKDVVASVIEEQKKLAAQSESSLDSDDTKNAIKALEAIGVKVPLSDLTAKMPAGEKGVYDKSAFLSYLGTIAYAANGDFDHAKDFSLVLKETNPKVDVKEDLSIPAGKGRLNVVALSGTIGKRTEEAEMFTLGQLFNVPLLFKIVYPVFDEKVQNHVIDSVKVTLSDGTAKNAVLIENFDNAVKIDVASKARGACVRSIVRNISKNSATTVAGVASLKAADEAVKKASGNPLTEMAAKKGYEAAVVGLNAGIVAIVDAEKADIRQGEYFPHMANAAGFSVAPGTYSVKVEYLSGNSVVETKEIFDVVVEAGKSTAVVSSCEK